jgi:hypothetical protein
MGIAVSPVKTHPFVCALTRSRARRLFQGWASCISRSLLIA